jgi:hypothetical protein
MAGQQNRRARLDTGDPRYYVFRVPGHHHRTALVQPRAVLHLGRNPELV